MKSRLHDFWNRPFSPLGLEISRTTIVAVGFLLKAMSYLFVFGLPAFFVFCAGIAYEHYRLFRDQHSLLFLWLTIGAAILTTAQGVSNSRTTLFLSGRQAKATVEIQDGKKLNPWILAIYGLGAFVAIGSVFFGTTIGVQSNIGAIAFFFVCAWRICEEFRQAERGRLRM